MMKDYTRDTNDEIYSRWIGRSYPNRHKWTYSHKYRFMWRKVRTMNELRQLRFDESMGLPVRRRRLNLPTLWDDCPLSRNFGKSWKDYTKKRHQWEDG